MSESLETLDCDKAQLGSLLELLHRADIPFRSVEATYRIWRHEERASAAWRAGMEEETRRGASISTYDASDKSCGPAEREEVLRIWRADDRVREEHEGGWQDGAYGVRDGKLWWSWNEGSGAVSNQEDPHVGSGIGEQLEFMLDPTPLLGVLRFAVIGGGRVAGRDTVTAEAVPRAVDVGRRPPSYDLDELGAGADRYRLEVDAQRGVLLEVLALRDGEPFQRITTVEVAFDHSISEERFRFQPPAGEEIQPTRGLALERLSLREAQRRAPFTVLIPDRIPSEGTCPACSGIHPTDRDGLAASRSSTHQTMGMRACRSRNSPRSISPP